MKKAYVFAGVSILLWPAVAISSKLLLGSMRSMQVLCVGALFAAVFYRMLAELERFFGCKILYDRVSPYHGCFSA